MHSRQLLRKLQFLGLVLLVTGASQSTFQKCNSESKASGKATSKISTSATEAITTATNKTEVGLFADQRPSAFNLARFYASNSHLLDEHSQDVLLSTLGLTEARKEQSASQLRSLTDSILFRNRSRDRFVVTDAVWSYDQDFPWGKGSGAEFLNTKGKKEAQISTWLKKNTRGMICTDPMSHGDSDKTYRAKPEAIFATCSYAGLKWTKPFSASETQPENFFSRDSWSELEPPGKALTMKSRGTFDLFSDSQINAVKLPCLEKGATTSCEVVLAVPAKGPGSMHDLQATLKDWDALKWRKWLRNFRPVLIDLSVPKVHLKRYAERGDAQYELWTNKLLPIIPNRGRCKISDIAAAHNAVLDERGFRFAEAAEYELSRDQRPIVSPVIRSPNLSNHRNNPPGLTYFSYHAKPGMTIDQPFMILVFDKKTSALIYLTIGSA